MSELTAFLGWTLLINFIILVLATFVLISMRETTLGIHEKMLGLGRDDLLRAYTQYLSQYKIAIFVFNLAPYLALRLMG